MPTITLCPYKIRKVRYLKVYYVESIMYRSDRWKFYQDLWRIFTLFMKVFRENKRKSVKIHDNCWKLTRLTDFHEFSRKLFSQIDAATHSSILQILVTGLYSLPKIPFIFIPTSVNCAKRKEKRRTYKSELEEKPLNLFRRQWKYLGQNIMSRFQCFKRLLLYLTPSVLPMLLNNVIMITTTWIYLNYRLRKKSHFCFNCDFFFFVYFYSCNQLSSQWVKLA